MTRRKFVLLAGSTAVAWPLIAQAQEQTGPTPRIAYLGASVRASQQQASGRNLRTAYGKVVAFVGDPPKHVGITEFDSLDQAVAYRNSQAFKDLDPLRNKAIKIVRQYAVEVEN